MEKELERLMNSYGNDVLRTAFMYLKDKHLAEDVFQEVFIKVYKNFHKFNGQSSEKTWIIAITINTCRDILRSSWIKRVLRFQDPEYKILNIKENSIDIDNKAISNIENQDLLKQVMDLPKKYKEVILLYYYQELSTREISKILNVPEGTVRSRLYRARELLKYSIGGTIEYEG
ncbi:sigma-70 family RNA polymerase sigma factor [Clostridium sp. cel8]|uniref:sigma-70 family RNA polymerase sigma factor n=1 Tax=unclassified Clostridium TaxID=2614128 RepID=UPI0015F77698|nr:sigma-70 family RNA polymerase sigma factor [Clostridium sp. cel8]MBA5850388.1 sigma-70 family RNA polymerase sigma factor [Clostridium sp. cel8]